MPAFVTCKDRRLEKPWNVGSDDFVIPAFFSVVTSIFLTVLLLAVLAAFYASPNCLDVPIPPILYGSFFALLIIEVATAIDETIILSISSRGTITDDTLRRKVEWYVYARILLGFADLGALVACTFAVVSPSVTDDLDCPGGGAGYTVALRLSQAVVIIRWVILVAFVIKGLYYVDPLGCCTPGLIQYLTFLDSSDDKGTVPSPTNEKDEVADQGISPFGLTNAHVEMPTSPGNRKRYWSRARRISSRAIDPSTIPVEHLQRIASGVHNSNVSQGNMLRRLRAVFCCLGVGGHRSRGTALEDVAKALYTLFHGENIVLSDIISGLILLHKDQERKLKGGGRNTLTEKFREQTFEAMPQKQRQGYEYKPPEDISFASVDDRLELDELLHYLHYAIGVYGWPLHLFMNLCCGLCQLSAKTCCVCNYRCCNDYAKEGRYMKESLCMCGMAAMRLQTGISERDIIFATYENLIYHAPFSVCVDHERKSVVIAVRGTLSIKDALTDMSFSLKNIPIPGYRETYVHAGMYRAAHQIKELLESPELNILERAFEYNKGYQLVITGHSLGAGVASVLALLLKDTYKDLDCYCFSPPGCLMSYPLAVYSRRFITSVVLGSDIVPRISFRSLLHLKHSVQHLVEQCDVPKHRVLEPNCMSKLPCCRVEYNTALPEDLESNIVNKDTTQSSIQRQLLSQRTFVRQLSHNPSGEEVVTSRILGDAMTACTTADTERFMPAFLPGKVLHIEVERDKEAACCFGCWTPERVTMATKGNEDFCVVEVAGIEMMNAHLPNELLAALKLCKSQLVDPHYKNNSTEVAVRREERRQEKLAKQMVREESKSGDHKFVFPTNPRTRTLPSCSSLPSMVPDHHQDLFRGSSTSAINKYHHAPWDTLEEEEHVAIQVEADIHPDTRSIRVEETTTSVEHPTSLNRYMAITDPSNHKPTLIELQDLQFHLEDESTAGKRGSSFLRNPIHSTAMLIQSFERSPGPAIRMEGQKPPTRRQNQPASLVRQTSIHDSQA